MRVRVQVARNRWQAASTQDLTNFTNACFAVPPGTLSVTRSDDIDGTTTIEAEMSDTAESRHLATALMALAQGHPVPTFQPDPAEGR